MLLVLDASLTGRFPHRSDERQRELTDVDCNSKTCLCVVSLFVLGKEAVRVRFGYIGHFIYSTSRSWCVCVHVHVLYIFFACMRRHPPLLK